MFQQVIDHVSLTLWSVSSKVEFPTRVFGPGPSRWTGFLTGISEVFNIDFEPTLILSGRTPLDFVSLIRPGNTETPIPEVILYSSSLIIRHNTSGSVLNLPLQGCLVYFVWNSPRPLFVVRLQVRSVRSSEWLLVVIRCFPIRPIIRYSVTPQNLSSESVYRGTYPSTH